MKWNYWRLLKVLSSLVLVVLCLVTSIKIKLKASEFNPSDYITFGVYSDTEEEIVESTSVRFDEHVLYGVSQGIYNYYKTQFGNNNNFPNDYTVIRTRLINLLGQDFWSNVSNYRFLCNAYRFTNSSEYIILTFTRSSIDDQRNIFERRINMNDLVTFEILPDNYTGGHFIFVNLGGFYKMYNILAPYNRSDLSTSSSSYLSSTSTSVTYSDITDAMSSQTVRSFFLAFYVHTPNITFSTYENNFVNAFVDDETLGGVVSYGLYSLVPLMSDFPVYTYDNATNDTTSAFLYSASWPTMRLYYNRLSNVYWYERMSPILITGYGDIPNVTPTPTSTPTPLPTWTPYPTATSFPPVNEIEGISQMMTLFTRKYEFNINGNVIGIRPLYLFVFTFLVGAIFKAIQGGDRN